MIARLFTLFMMMSGTRTVSNDIAVYIITSTGHNLTDGTNLIIQKD